MCQPVTFKPGDKIQLKDIDPRKVDGDWTKETAAEKIAENTLESRHLAYRLYAEESSGIATCPTRDGHSR